MKARAKAEEETAASERRWRVAEVERVSKARAAAPAEGSVKRAGMVREESVYESP